MITAPSLLLALRLGSAAVPVAEFDIPYFLANPKVHEETLRRCHNDVRLAMTPECENAELAGTRRIGRPLSPQSLKDSPFLRPINPTPRQPKPVPAPVRKGKEYGA
jgi:hypothetical protein